MISTFLFALGLALGSFINVIAARYRAGGKVFTTDVIAGRSHCPACRKVLSWYELLPLVSFFMQKWECRHCGHRLSWQYPISEILGGLILVLVPGRFGFSVESAVWILALLILLLITLIDLRLSVIPDQLNAVLALLGLVSFSGNKLIGLVFSAGVFGLIILITRGKGMGIGDLKLAAALGFLFGWPKIILLVMAAFIIGGVWAAGILILKKKGLKDSIPFGPFLSTASAVVLFFGDAIINLY